METAAGLQEALARQDRRLDPRQVLQPVEVKSVDDIRRLVAQLDPNTNQAHSAVPLVTNMNVPEDNKNVVYRVEATTRSKSRRDILLEGLTVIKNRINIADRMRVLAEPVEVNGVEMKPAALGDGVQGSNWVDPLIRQWLGGFRDGVTVCWDLHDGYIYKYDVFAHRLTRSGVESPVEKKDG